MFAEAQAHYAERGIATFPVTDAKKPAVRGYLNVGLNYSRELADRFPDKLAFGFATNGRNGITILDIDTTDEKVLADALQRHGQTPLIARTASGKFHAYYKHNGEKRRIRPWPGHEIDVLGTGGMAVAVPSVVKGGSYEFIEGCLHLVPELPVLRNLDLPIATRAHRGERNNRLFRHCMRNAHYVDTFDALLDVARTFNDDCLPPMEDSEVLQTAESAWGYTERGQNRFGQFGAWFPFEEVATWGADPDAFYLLAFLRANQGPASMFMCSNGLAEKFGWGRKRLAEARHRLIALGYLNPVRQAGRGNPAQFRWAR
jgi:hypothetical protein